MKITKNILIVILCISLCIGCTAFAADTSGGFEPAEYGEAVQMLEDLGIASGGAYSDYDASVIMTRGEFAALALDILALRDDAKSASFTQKYADVPSSHAYAKEINFASSLGLFGGVSKTEFSPDTPIYIEQAIKVAVCMAGYGTMAEAKGGYPTGYLTLANQIKITENVYLGGSGGALRGNVIVLMYNTLFADMVRTDGYTDGGADYSIIEDETILSEYHDITEAEGIIEANGLYSISGDTTEDNYIRIGKNTYYTESDEAMESVGKNVKYYYKKINGKNTVLTVREKDNGTVVLKADDCTFDVKKQTYTLDAKNKTHSFRLDPKYSLVYNMALVTGEGVTDFARFLSPENGSITLIDNNNDGRYDVVIVEESKTVIFNSYDEHKNTIYDKFDRSFDICLDDYDRINVTDSLKNTISIEKIKMNSVLSVYESVNGEAVKIIVYTERPAGKISRSGEDKVYIGSEEYEFSLDARISNNIKTGKTYTLYLNFSGKIVYYEENSSAKTGYILRSGKTGGGLDGGCSVQILGSEGVVTYKLADSVKVETAEKKTTVKADSVSDTLKTFADSFYGAGVNNDARLFVQYGENTDNEVNSITLPYVIKTKAEYDNPPSNYSFFKLDYIVEKCANTGSTLRYTPENRSAGMQMIFDSECILYYVPEFSDTSFGEDDPGINTLDSLERDDDMYFSKTFTGETNQVEAYSTNSDVEFVNALVWVKAEGRSTEVKEGYNNNMLVTSVSRALSDDGDDLIKIEGIINRNETVLYVNEDSVISADSMKNIPLDGILPTINASKTSLKAGDVIKYAVNSDGYTDKIALIYDHENDDICYKDTEFTDYGDKYRYTCGTVEKIKGGYLFLSLHDSSVTDYSTEPHMMTAFRSIYVYDSDSDTGKIGKSSEAAIGDSVFVCDNYRAPKELIIYKGGK